MKKDGLKKTKYPGMYLDPSLDEQYKGKVLFPKKLEMANEMLKKYGVPDPETTITYSESIKKNKG